MIQSQFTRRPDITGCSEGVFSGVDLHTFTLFKIEADQALVYIHDKRIAVAGEFSRRFGHLDSAAADERN